jgi:integrase
MKNRGMGGIYRPTYTQRQPDGTRVTKTAAVWWISYNLHGKRTRESSESTNRADATRLLKQRIGDMQAGRPVGSQVDRTTLDDMLGMVEADYKANGRRSLDRVQQAGAHLRRFYGLDRKAHDISGDMITAYAASRLSEDAKPSTVNYEMAMSRRAFRLAARAGKVANRPEVSMLHVNNARAGFFERDQHEAVLRHLPDYLRPVAIAAYATGWRTRSELLTRQWRHVDLANGWLRLDPGEGKTGEGRSFPLTQELRAVLEAQRERVREIEKTVGAIVPWVFVHHDGTPIRDFRYAWAKACREAGVPGRLVHDFRRTAVRNLERAGVPRSAATKMTGHRTESIYQRYAIVDAAMLEDAAAKLDVLHASEANGQRSVKVTSLQVKA